MAKINDSFFCNISKLEQDSVLSTATHVFFGLHMSQHPLAVVKLNQLLATTKPSRIIEIGSGNGGLTVLLALYAILNNVETFFYDKAPGLHAELLSQMGRPIFSYDVLEDQRYIAEVGAQIASVGRTIVFCDAGKALEFNLYAPFLKVGDFILMHDFSPTPKTFETYMKGKIWNWHESWYARVEDTCEKYNIVHTSYFNDVAWSCGWKEKSLTPG